MEMQLGPKQADSATTNTLLVFLSLSLTLIFTVGLSGWPAMDAQIPMWC